MGTVSNIIDHVLLPQCCRFKGGSYWPWVQSGCLSVQVDMLAGSHQAISQAELLTLLKCCHSHCESAIYLETTLLGAFLTHAAF